MKRRCKILISIFFILFFISSYKAYAVYDDESLSWAIENNIITGNKDKIINNDKALSAEEFITIIMRSYHSTDLPCGVATNGHWANNYIDGAKFLNIINDNSWKSMKLKLTREKCWEIIMNESDFAPYPYWMYDNSKAVLKTSKDISNGLIVSNLISSTINSKETPSKGEIINLIYKINTHDYIMPLPNHKLMIIPITMDKPNADWITRNSAYYDLSKIPEKFINAFINAGYKIIVTPHITTYAPEFTTAVGLTRRVEKEVILGSFNYTPTHGIMLHEMGHCIEDIANHYYFGSIMYEETNKIANATGTNYCKTNQYENFAEAFRIIMSNYNSNYAMNWYELLFPYTYHCIVDGYIKPNDICDLDKLNELTSYYWDYLYN